MRFSESSYLLMSFNKAAINLLFETSWEVCNKIGGIYTVLSSKAKTLKKLYGDNVIFIGPDFPSDSASSPLFTESASVLRKWREGASLSCGLRVRTGRWEIPGRPKAILVDFSSLYAYKNEFYAEMWNHFGVDSLHAYGDYDESCMFSIAAAMIIENIVNFTCRGKEEGVIAHFDEWTTGMGLLYIKSRMPRIATVFTTHATTVGRSICGNGKELYRYFKGYNGDQMSHELNVESKHSLEKAAAWNADCFTTVSDITAEECEQILGRRPAVITPNGFDSSFVPAPTKFKAKRKAARETLLNVAGALTGVEFDDDSFIVCTSGRCEYRNKGIDLFIDAVDRLGETDIKRKAVCFIMVPAWESGARSELAYSLATGTKSPVSDPVITHNLNNYDSDIILKHIHDSRFTNDKSGRVFIIYVPCYLNGNDGIFNTPYYDLLVGMDATVFASYYEPWGYTPLESVAFGVPTVTTSLSGFGRWILSDFGNALSGTGVAVIPRDDSNYVSCSNSIAAVLRQIAGQDAESAADLKTAAMNTSLKAAWEYFIEAYVEAYRIALENAKLRNN